MKKIIILPFIALILIVRVNAQITIPEKMVLNQPTMAAHITKVISAIVSRDSVTQDHNSNSYHNYFKATIQSIGTGSINYKWILAPPLVGSFYRGVPVEITGSITLSGTGTDYIYIEKPSRWLDPRDPSNPFPRDNPVHYLIGLKIINPNQLSSQYIEAF